jgi:hypothetical protein
VYVICNFSAEINLIWSGLIQALFSSQNIIIV